MYFKGISSQRDSEEDLGFSFLNGIQQPGLHQAKPGARSQTLVFHVGEQGSKYLSHHRLPSQAHWQGAGSQGSSTDMKKLQCGMLTFQATTSPAVTPHPPLFHMSPSTASAPFSHVALSPCFAALDVSACWVTASKEIWAPGPSDRLKPRPETSARFTGCSQQGQVRWQAVCDGQNLDIYPTVE